jgi:hypothetical protein
MQIGNTQQPAFNPTDYVAGPPVLAADPGRLVAAPSLEDLNAPPQDKLLAEKVKQARTYEGDHQVVDEAQQVSGLHVNITT